MLRPNGAGRRSLANAGLTREMTKPPTPRHARHASSYDVSRSKFLTDRNAPATKGDIADLEERLDQKFGQIDQKFEQIRSEMNHGYADLAERISDSETRLLKAFYDFAQSNQKRLAEIESN